MKKAIVVGASSGIGKELAKILVSNNYKTGIVGRRTNLILQLKDENPEMYVAKSIDITHTGNLAKNLEELTLELGGFDLMVLCAGNGELNENLDNVIEQAIIDINVTAWTFIANWSFNYFNKQKHGHFISISSIGGLRGNKVAPSYNASKAYQINYTEGLRQKANYSKLPIYVTDVRPGLVNTAMAKTNIKFWIVSPEKAALQIYQAIEEKRKVIYISKRWRLFAWILKVIPTWIYSRL